VAQYAPTVGLQHAGKEMRLDADRFHGAQIFAFVYSAPEPPKM
jgi:hypothetical protein